MKVTTQNFLTPKVLSAADIQRMTKSMAPLAAGSEVKVAEDGSLVTGVPKSLEEFASDWAASQAVHGSGAYQQAGDAIDTLTKRIGAVAGAVAAQRPNLATAKWDFALKDGKFVVSGSGLSKSDSAFIEAKLNGDPALVDAANSFMDAAVKNLQIADDYQGGTINSMYGGSRQIAFENVAKQLNGAIDFRHFLAKNADMATAHGQLKIGLSDYGFSALDLLGSQLSSKASSVGYAIFPPAGTT